MLSASFFWPAKLTFSYSHSNCFFNPTILPGTVSRQSSQAFHVETPATLSIGGVALYSATTCVTLTNPAPGNDTQTVALAPLGNPLLKKIIQVTAGQPPALAKTTVFDKPLAAQEPLIIPLSQADTVFDYHLSAGDKTTGCTKKDAGVTCNLTPLGLAQATKYTFTLTRSLGGKPGGTVFSHEIVTVNPLNLSTATIPAGQKVFAVPTDITLTFDKPLASVDGVHLRRVDAEKRDLPITTSQDGSALHVHFTSPLPRTAQLELSVDHARAQDGAYLPSTLVHPFSTSGGPQVQAINIGSTRVAPGSAIVLTFDSLIGGGQDLQKFISVELGGKRLAATVSARDKTITIAPQGLDRCAIFKVKVTDGIASDVGVTGGSAWQFTSRTQCQASFSIGTSVKGRSITGYKFGNGPSKVIFVGTIHGDEKSASYTLNAFMNSLESNFERIPANRTVIVIPIANPDGYASNTRANANGQDLNRNFPANNWKQGINTQYNGYQPNGGGDHPLSEPESQALASYVSAQGARAVLSYHAVAGIVAANEAGDSLALANSYGQKASMPSYGNNAGALFEYDTTGAFEDWLADRLGIPGLLVELSTKSSNEFSRHQNAMWAMATLP